MQYEGARRLSRLNIFAGHAYNFKKRTEINSLGSKYDKKSIMHYDGYAFSSNSRPTIMDKATGVAVDAQRDDLSKSDLYQVNKMYGCEEQLSKMRKHLYSRLISIRFVANEDCKYILSHRLNS